MPHCPAAPQPRSQGLRPHLEFRREPRFGKFSQDLHRNLEAGSRLPSTRCFPVWHLGRLVEVPGGLGPHPPCRHRRGSHRVGLQPGRVRVSPCGKREAVWAESAAGRHRGHSRAVDTQLAERVGIAFPPPHPSTSKSGLLVPPSLLGKIPRHGGHLPVLTDGLCSQMLDVLGGPTWGNWGPQPVWLPLHLLPVSPPAPDPDAQTRHEEGHQLLRVSCSEPLDSSIPTHAPGLKLSGFGAGRRNENPTNGQNCVFVC